MYSVHCRVIVDNMCEFQQQSNEKITSKVKFAPAQSCPTEALVWINEFDSAWDRTELKSSNSLVGRMIPDFKLLDSSALNNFLTASFKKASLHGRAKGTTRQSIPERMTNCLHDQ